MNLKVKLVRVFKMNLFWMECESNIFLHFEIKAMKLPFNWIRSKVKKKFGFSKWNLYFIWKGKYKLELKNVFNRDLNRGCLVYMFSFRFSGRKFLINLRRISKSILCTWNFSYISFYEICSIFILCLKWKCVIYVIGWSFTKTCSLIVCWQALLFQSME